MAELENNLEAIEEAQQPDSNAEKGDKVAPKQGSSDAESVDSGKAPVVKPEENPVDKAVDAIHKAEDETKPVKDAVNKQASAPEKGEKLKEDEDSDEVKLSKMESIKAVVNTMKDMTKEELQTAFGSISEEEVDESLTKAEVARKIVETLKGMDEADVAKFAEGWMKKGEEEEEEEVKKRRSRRIY